MSLAFFTFLCVIPAAIGAAPTLTATPAVLPVSGAEVTLKFDLGGAAPAAADVVEVVSGGVSIGLLPVSMASGWESGAAAFPPMPLVNMLTDGYLFNYKSGPTVLASTLVKFANGTDEVTQVHLAMTSDVRTMTVSFVTGSTAAHEVQWGSSASALTHTSPSTCSTYTIADMCSSPANLTENWVDPGQLHVANVSHGFTTPTRVYYRVGSSVTNCWSDVFSFVTPPTPGADVETRMVVYADAGVLLPFVTKQEQQPPAAKVAKLVHDQQVDDRPLLVTHVGDISYARGYAFLWPWFMSMIEPIAASAPYHVGVGNHEVDDTTKPSWTPPFEDYMGNDAGGECNVPTHNRFNSPGYQDSARRNLWYSTDFGNIHIAVVSTEHDFLEGSAQWSWLNADLAAVNRSVTPWIIVTGHRPAYSSSEGHRLVPGPTENFNDYYRATMDSLCNKYGVNMFMAGHVHVYERTVGFTTNFTAAPSDSEGTVHITMGSAGNVYNPDWAYYLPETSPALSSGHHNQPDWSIFRTMNFGYTTINSNATHLQLQFIGAQRGQVHDQVTLHR